jgi:hypothetical protein
MYANEWTDTTAVDTLARAPMATLTELDTIARSFDDGLTQVSASSRVWQFSADSHIAGLSCRQIADLIDAGIL